MTSFVLLCLTLAQSIIREAKGMHGIQAKSKEVSQEGEQGFPNGNQTQQL